MDFIEDIGYKVIVNENNSWIFREKLIKPENLKTRPLKDLVKELFLILFLILIPEINLFNSNVLDLFSGVDPLELNVYPVELK